MTIIVAMIDEERSPGLVAINNACRRLRWEEQWAFEFLRTQGRRSCGNGLLRGCAAGTDPPHLLRTLTRASGRVVASTVEQSFLGSAGVLEGSFPGLQS